MLNNLNQRHLIELLLESPVDLKHHRSQPKVELFKYELTNQLTPWSRFILEMLIVTQLVKK